MTTDTTAERHQKEDNPSRERMPLKTRTRHGQKQTFKRKLAEEKAMRTQAEANTMIDSRTGLKNSKWFEEQLDVAIANAERHPEQTFWFQLIDFDNFKKFNDVDYAVGNKVLKIMGSVGYRPGEDLARWGGDEFAQLVNSGIGEDEAIRVAVRNANRINQLSKESLAQDKDAVNVGISEATVSIALLKYMPSMSAEQMLKSASALLKASKKSEKKDRIFVSSDGGVTSSEVDRREAK